MTFYKECPDCGSTKIIEYRDGNLWVESCDECGITLSDSWIGDDDEDDAQVAPSRVPSEES